MSKIIPAPFAPQADKSSGPSGAASRASGRVLEREVFLAELKRQMAAGEYKPDPREVAKTILHILVPPD